MKLGAHSSKRDECTGIYNIQCFVIRRVGRAICDIIQNDCGIATKIPERRRNGLYVYSTKCAAIYMSVSDADRKLF